MIFEVLCFVSILVSIRGTPAPDTESPSISPSCASCGLSQTDGATRLDVDLLEAVKRHILSRLQMRDRPNITHSIPKAAMVTALKKLHAGKVREDGRVEIPNLDGHAASMNEVEEETSEIISFAETGVYAAGMRVSERAARLRAGTAMICDIIETFYMGGFKHKP